MPKMCVHLEKLEKTKFREKKEQPSNSENKFPTSLLIVGGIGVGDYKKKK